jgi:transcriptional regulator with XRE-family HTH domain
LKDYVLVPSSLGELIKKARKEKKMTQEELTDELAISTGTVSNVERGNYKVSKQKLFDLCKKLDLDLPKIKLLFDEEDSKNIRYNLKMQLMSIEHVLDLVSHESGWEDLCKIQLDKNEPLRSLYEYLRGRCYEEEKNWEQAEICFLNSIRCIDSHEYLQESNIKSACFNGLSRIQNRQDNMDKALYYVEKGLDTFVSDGERKHVYYHLLISKVVYLEKINRNREALMILEELWRKKDRIERLKPVSICIK